METHQGGQQEKGQERRAFKPLSLHEKYLRGISSDLEGIAREGRLSPPKISRELKILKESVTPPKPDEIRNVMQSVWRQMNYSPEKSTQWGRELNQFQLERAGLTSEILKLIDRVEDKAQASVLRMEALLPVSQQMCIEKVLEKRPIGFVRKYINSSNEHLFSTEFFHAMSWEFVSALGRRSTDKKGFTNMFNAFRAKMSTVLREDQVEAMVQGLKSDAALFEYFVRDPKMAGRFSVLRDANLDASFGVDFILIDQEAIGKEKIDAFKKLLAMSVDKRDDFAKMFAALNFSAQEKAAIRLIQLKAPRREDFRDTRELERASFKDIRSRVASAEKVTPAQAAAGGDRGLESFYATLRALNTSGYVVGLPYPKSFGNDGGVNLDVKNNVLSKIARNV